MSRSMSLSQQILTHYYRLKVKAIPIIWDKYLKPLNEKYNPPDVDPFSGRKIMYAYYSKQAELETGPYLAKLIDQSLVVTTNVYRDRTTALFTNVRPDQVYIGPVIIMVGKKEPSIPF